MHMQQDRIKWLISIGLFVMKVGNMLLFFFSYIIVQINLVILMGSIGQQISNFKVGSGIGSIKPDQCFKIGVSCILSYLLFLASS